MLIAPCRNALAYFSRLKVRTILLYIYTRKFDFATSITIIFVRLVFRYM
jgi:hypothetical protein